MTNFRDWWTSMVRTTVPIIVGALMASKAGPFIDPAAATELVTSVFAIAYYALVRVGETFVTPQFGWFLGVPRQPVYDVDTGDLAAVPEWDRLDVDPDL
jgi:hypothetical protein